MIKSRKFVISFAIALPLMFVLYGVFVNFWFIHVDTFPSSYKNFVLRSAPSPKVVIASGSNSYMGIDPEILEEYFHVPVINYGDIASYPINARLAIIEPHLKPGDTLILPIEYRLYVDAGLKQDATFGFKVAQGKATEYFRHVTFYERMQLIYKFMPPKHIYHTIFSERGLVVRDDYVVSRLKEYQGLATKDIGTARGTKFGETKQKRKFFSQYVTCDHYVFEKMASNPKLGGWYKQAYERILRLKQSGVNVIYTWPVIVSYFDDECMTTPAAGDAMDFVKTEIIPELERNGIPFIGTQESVKFTGEYFYDSYYHVTRPAAEARTRILLEDLAKAGVKPYDNPDFDSEQFSKQILAWLAAAVPGREAN